MIARALAFLGLGGPANVWALAAMHASKAGSPEHTGAESLVAGLAHMPHGKLSSADAASLVARVRAVLCATPRLQEAIEAADPKAFDRWAHELQSGGGSQHSGFVLLRARDGALLRMPDWSDIDAAASALATADGRRAYAACLQPPARAAQSASFPPCDPQAPGTPPEPVLVVGFGSCAVLERLRHARPPHALGAAGVLHVVEPALERVFAALAMSVSSSDADANLSSLSNLSTLSWLAEDRIIWSVGPEARTHAAGHWGARLGYWSTLSAVPDPSLSHPELNDAVSWFERTKRDLLGMQAAELHRLVARAADVDRERDDAWWSRRLTDVSTAREGPRVLVLTSRFTTYVQHAASDLCEAFSRLGGPCEVAMEPDDGSTMMALGIAQAIERVDPDVIVTINYPRSAMPKVIPHSIPVVTWVQDAMPHLFNRAVARDLGPRDAVVGFIFNDLITEHQLPAARCLRIPVLASATKFARARIAVSPKPAVDVLIASNHGESPEATAARLEREVLASGGPAGIVERIASRLWAAAETWTTGYSVHLMQAVVRAAIEDHGRVPIHADVQELTQKIATPLFQRWTRHRLVSLAARVCDRRGWTLALHGRGWTDVPECARFARPPLAHDQMPDAYASAAVTLHASPDWPVHQRIFECLLAGGLPAIRLKPEDPAFVLNVARRAIEELCHRETRTVLTDAQRSARVSSQASDGSVCAIDHPGAARGLLLAQRMLGSFGRAPDANAIPIESTMVDGRFRFTQDPARPVFGAARARGITDMAPPWTTLDLLDAIEPATFVTDQQLEYVVHRARTDHAWRSATIEHGRDITERWFTFERAAGAIMSFLEHGAGDGIDTQRNLHASDDPTGPEVHTSAGVTPTVDVHAA